MDAILLKLCKESTNLDEINYEPLLEIIPELDEELPEPKIAPKPENPVPDFTEEKIVKASENLPYKNLANNVEKYDEKPTETNLGEAKIEVKPIETKPAVTENKPVEPEKKIEQKPEPEDEYKEDIIEETPIQPEPEKPKEPEKVKEEPVKESIPELPVKESIEKPNENEKKIEPEIKQEKVQPEEVKKETKEAEENYEDNFDVEEGLAHGLDAPIEEPVTKEPEENLNKVIQNEIKEEASKPQENEISNKKVEPEKVQAQARAPEEDEYKEEPLEDSQAEQDIDENAAKKSSENKEPETPKLKFEEAPQQEKTEQTPEKPSEKLPEKSPEQPKTEKIENPDSAEKIQEPEHKSAEKEIGTEGKMSENQEIEIDEEQMIEVAQNAFNSITEKMLQNGLSIRGLFGSFIHKEQNQETNEEIEVISSEDFVNQIRSLDIAELEDLQYACLIKVLSVNDDQKYIKFDELIQILSESGVPENAANSAKKEHAAQLNYSDLDSISMVLMLALTEYLLKAKMPLYDLFADVIYQQAVKTKTKQKTVELVNSSDFFAALFKIGIKMEESEHENLKKFLCLDPKYIDKIHMKKLKAAVTEFATNEELRATAQKCYKDLIADEEGAGDAGSPEEGENENVNAEESPEKGETAENKQENLQDEYKFDEDDLADDGIEGGNEDKVEGEENNSNHTL